MQWVALHPEITHTAFRVYAVMRALYIKRRDMRTLSKDQLRYLMPGVNGKAMGRTALSDALKVLEKFGLVTNPDGKSQTWRIRDPETKKFVSQTKHSWLLANLPVEGDGFTGWRNVFDKLDAYEGDWETNPPTPPREAADTDGADGADEGTGDGGNVPGDSHDRNSGNGAAGTGEPPTLQPSALESVEETAGQSQRRNSGTPRPNSGNRSRNSGSGCRNSGKPKPVTRGNSTLKNRAQERTEEEPQEEDKGGQPPLNPPGPAADAAGTSNAGNYAYRKTTES